LWLRKLRFAGIELSMASGFNFKGRRRDLALVFRKARTAKEAARAIGVETGSIFGLVRRMAAEGIIEPLGPGEPTRGTEYILTEDAAYALTLELERTTDPEGDHGTVVNGQEVLFARGGRLLDIQAVFADPSLSLVIAWAATLGADWLLALTVDADKFAAQKLIAALEKVGCQCDYGKVDSKLSGSRLRERAGGLVSSEARR
jgi:hypothetical protein